MTMMMVIVMIMMMIRVLDCLSGHVRLCDIMLLVLSVQGRVAAGGIGSLRYARSTDRASLCATSCCEIGN